METRWAGSAGTRRLGPAFDVADPEGRCCFIGLPDRSAGQALDAIQVIVVLPEKGTNEVVSDWLPAAELSQH
jgi:hypothetical protein